LENLEQPKKSLPFNLQKIKIKILKIKINKVTDSSEKRHRENQKSEKIITIAKKIGSSNGN
jgi:hypothetical protein